MEVTTPQTQPQTLFEKYGGKSTVDTLVNYFYEELVLKDDLVRGFFTHIDMAAQKKKQSNFISFALGSHNKYTGRTMKASHLHMHIKDIHFDRIVQHLATTLRVHGVEEADIQAIAQRLEPFREDIVEKDNVSA